ncbi:hypothetical protein E8E14_007598 [Neopestalotiopsis sp. 37M]|nr:hypothetical protein E8E14_007598 [Neopestalotiopsis sp. 37M]
MVTPNSRPSVLLGSGGNYYQRSKPQYETLAASSFVSVRAAGAKGDASADDSRIVSLEGNISNVNIYNLNTIGSLSMINRDGTSLASWQDNVNTFAANIAVFKSG